VSGPILDVAGISKNYHGLRPLRIERLELSRGERVAIAGLDAPAAETLVNLITGATLPDSGTVRIFGRPTSDISDSADWLATVDRFGILSPRAVLLDGLSVTQNLAVPFTLDIEPPPDDVQARAKRLAQEVGIGVDEFGTPVAAVGPLTRARVRLARAVALDPAILLVEHASAELARGDVSAFGNLIAAVAAARGAAVLAMTADERFGKAIAGRVLTLEGATGRLRRAWF